MRGEPELLGIATAAGACLGIAPSVEAALVTERAVEWGGNGSARDARGCGALGCGARARG